jgi:membrane-associated phospholipid phosphatase
VAGELLLIAAAAMTYGGVRAATEGSTASAVENGKEILAVERQLGIDWEDSLQAPILARDLLVTLANWVYIWGHWPVIAAVAIALYRWNRPSYSLLRNAVFISGAIGFLFFALLPTAPPRLLNVGLTDTVLERSTAYRALQPPELTNQFAAFPSLHFGWNLLVGIVLFLSYRNIPLRVFAAAMPIAMALAVIVTGNHYVLDVGGGAAVVAVGLVAALALERRASPTLDVNVAVADGPRGRPFPSVRHRARQRQRPAAPQGRRSTSPLARRS